MKPLPATHLLCVRPHGPVYDHLVGHHCPVTAITLKSSRVRIILIEPKTYSLVCAVQASSQNGVEGRGGTQSMVGAFVRCEHPTCRTHHIDHLLRIGRMGIETRSRHILRVEATHDSTMLWCCNYGVHMDEATSVPCWV